MMPRAGALTLTEISRRISEEPDDRVGAIFKEYVRETLHQNFDGFSDRSKSGAKALLEDFWLFLSGYQGEPRLK